MGVNPLQGVIGLQQRCGGFFADASHAGDVVGFIAHQGFVIHHLVGADAQRLQDIFG